MKKLRSLGKCWYSVREKFKTTKLHVKENRLSLETPITVAQRLTQADDRTARETLYDIDKP